MSKDTTIEVLVDLLERQTSDAEAFYAGGADLVEENHYLRAELEGDKVKIEGLNDEIVELRYDVAALNEACSAAIKRANHKSELAREHFDRFERVTADLEEANGFVQQVADLVENEDWLGLKQEFGFDSKLEVGDYLETAEDYRLAPVGTIVAWWDAEVESGFERTDKGWVYAESGDDYLFTPEQLVWKDHSRKVLTVPSVQRLANGL